MLPPLPRNDPKALAWFQALADAYRRKAQSVPKVVLQRVHANQRFGRRTQFLHVWMKLHPPIDCHFVLAVHFPDLPDKLVESWGPIEPKDLARTLEEVDKVDWYHRPVKKKRRGPFVEVSVPTQHGLLHESVDIHLKGLYDEVRYRAFNPRDRDDRELYLHGIKGEGGAGRFNGDLFGRDPGSIVGYYFQEAAANVKRIRDHKRQRQAEGPVPYYQEPPIDGHTAVLFPAHHIGKNPARTITERFWGKRAWSAPGNFVLDRTYNGTRVLATYEGHIGVVLADKEAARDFLNMACYALRVAGVPVIYLRPRDVGGFIFRKPGDPTEEGLEFRSYSYAPDDRPTADKADHVFYHRVVTLAQIERAFRRATKLVKDPDLHAYRDLLEAESQHEEERFRQAFFLAWTLVERRLGEVWEQVLHRAVGQGPKRSMTVEWKPIIIAGALQQAGHLSHELVGRIRALNSKRNEIVHTKSATKADAEAMLETARNAVKELRAAQKSLRRRR